ncbi:MAG: formylglycine-generating enzyme family protein [Chloroflexi bacterium]|jgi:formylglycine-generating enzyme required for sulfatase activity|nr:formylglycine-generating enzyme family protein [Anaerolineaceae bacterium]NLI44673.1 formylglycine-generating enzyme family protein [Chloroflexota bacterium]HOE35759.1 formylglycine-generating enzyme family protein [Anaerolineaceae bacterium]HOT26170.1 formylglycine-generating enzyme family protein [Anaerolineaceae bacterium]HQK03606.1 formylglycine-generating enzyme family protein [Anaerolineaceae bacterium]
MKLFPLLTSVIICALLLGCSGAPLTETFPTATPENADCAVDIWVAPEVPARVRENFVLPEGFQWASAAGPCSVTLGLDAFRAPGQVILAQVYWEYALVAPSWSFREGAASADLKAAWEGKARGSLMQLQQLVIYAEDYNALLGLLGEPAEEESLSEMISLAPNEKNSLSDQLKASVWAIVPLNRIQADYRVLAIDGISPLQSDFRQQPYALRGVYSLQASPQIAARLGEQGVSALARGLAGESDAELSGQAEAAAKTSTATVTAQLEKTSTPTARAGERVRPKDGAVEVLIPAGTFTTGCLQGHNGGFDCPDDELPSRRISLDAYYIDKFEVTNRQYALCVADGGCPEPAYLYSASRVSYYGNPDYADYPAANISWTEAAAYCAWAGVRLPTEFEWEKAARGTDLRAYPWGDSEPSCDKANAKDERRGSNCVGDTLPVGSLPEGASPYGVMDMAGNVWEWVQDWYVLDANGIRVSVDPFAQGLGFNKIVKGGSWDYSWSRLRISYNSDHEPDAHKISFGFRCASPLN